MRLFVQLDDPLALGVSGVSCLANYAHELPKAGMMGMNDADKSANCTLFRGTLLRTCRILTSR